MKEYYMLLGLKQKEVKIMDVKENNGIIEAGRSAYLTGMGRVLARGGSASDPLTGFLR